MNIKRITAVAAIFALTTLGGVAVAKTATHKTVKPAAAEATAPDTDNVQQGDQTAPDGTAGESTTETAGESSGESSDQADGPGGHEDPAGNVDHQFQGEE